MINKLLIIICFIFVYLFEMLISYLSLKSKKEKIPQKLSFMYNEEAYKKKTEYTIKRSRIVMFKKTIDFIIFLLLLILNGYSFLTNLLREKALLNDLFYFFGFVPVMYITLSKISDLIFKYIVVFKVNVKYGFLPGKTSTFFIGELKSYIFSIVIALSLTYSFTYLYSFFDAKSIMSFIISVIVTTLIYVTLSPYLQKINNRFISLEEGPLKEKIKALVTKYGFKVKRVKILLTQKKGYKVNAYITGLGQTKTIVIYDTLLKFLTDEEILGIVAHELGHSKKHHIVINMIFNLIRLFIMIFIIYLFVRKIDNNYEKFFETFGFKNYNYGFIYVVTITTILPFLKYISNIPYNYFIRINEYKADIFACKIGLGIQLRSALLKQSRVTYGSLTENKIVIILMYTHPPLINRIDNIEQNY